VYTIVETAEFSSQWPDYWTEGELGEFCLWLAQHAESGAVIKGSGGCRKVRWSRAGAGKRGGVRVIHYNRLASGEIFLLVIYAKSARASIPTKSLVKIRETIHGKND
jgi:hypothetical protein